MRLNRLSLGETLLHYPTIMAAAFFVDTLPIANTEEMFGLISGNEDTRKGPHSAPLHSCPYRYGDSFPESLS